MNKFNTLCGKCLHSKECHTEHNGHFMKCSRCSSLCEIDEYNQELKPTSLEIVYRIQNVREIGYYVPKEIKNGLQLENKSRQELTERYINE